MNKYAYIRDGVVRAITPPLAQQPKARAGFSIVVAPAGVVEGQAYANGKFGAPPAAAVLSTAQLVAYAASRRYTKEIGGITVADVGAVKTDRASQAQVAMAAARAQAVTWKLADGTFASLTAAQLTAMAAAVAAHVEACFAAEALAVAGIKATPAKVTTTAQIDAAFAGI